MVDVCAVFCYASCGYMPREIDVGIWRMFVFNVCCSDCV